MARYLLAKEANPFEEENIKKETNKIDKIDMNYLEQEIETDLFSTKVRDQF